MKTTYSFPVDAILLLGPTGSGKSPLGDHIARHGFFQKKLITLISVQSSAP